MTGVAPMAVAAEMEPAILPPTIYPHGGEAMTEHQAPSRRRPWLLGSIVAVVAIAGIAVLANGMSRDAAPAAPITQAPTAFTMTGTLTLNSASGIFQSQGYRVDRPCTGTGGYGDISAGAVVTVFSAAGTVVAVGRLNEGRIKGPAKCEFAFTVPLVPLSEQLYQVEVAHRGKVAVTAAEAKQGARLTLG